MIALIQKEINSFFASPIAYLVIGLFLVANGLFLWVIPGNYNILDNGFAELAQFFELAPWLLLFIIPALTMKSFSEEYKMGTIELLKTKPLSNLQILLGKYVATLILICIAILPSLIYLYSIGQLGSQLNNFDSGVVLGSYIGLFLLICTYTAIGVFSSILSDNQIIAFLLGVCISFIVFVGFNFIASIHNALLFIEDFGIQSHYKNISKGILDTRNIIYFLGLSLLFLIATTYKLERK